MKTFPNFCKGSIRPIDSHTNVDPEAPENIILVNLTFFFNLGQSASNIRRMLQTLDNAFGMNHSQLGDVAFKVFNREQQWKKYDANKTPVLGSGIGIPWRRVTWREVSHDWGGNKVLTIRRKNFGKQFALGWNLRKTVKDRASHLIEREEHLMNEEAQGLFIELEVPNSPHSESQVNFTVGNQLQVCWAEVEDWSPSWEKAGRRHQILEIWWRCYHWYGSWKAHVCWELLWLPSSS